MTFRIGILLLLALAAIRADTVELKTGERIDGRFRQATQAGVVIEVGGQPITFGIDKVRAIYLGSANAPQRAPSRSAEALDALKALNSVTSAGVTYSQYSARVLDAKILVDRFLASATGDPAHDALFSAMRYHEIASQAWSIRLSSSAGDYATLLQIGTELQHDPRLNSCPEVVAFVADALTPGGKLRRSMTAAQEDAMDGMTPDQLAAYFGTFVGQSPGLLWKCAATKVAEAEHITTKAKK